MLKGKPDWQNHKETRDNKIFPFEDLQEQFI